MNDMNFTPSPEYLNIASKALAACAEEDLWFPKPNPAVTVAWARHLQFWKFDLDDVIAGVRKMYEDNGAGFRPLPKDIVQAARSVRAERAKVEVVEEIRALGPAKASEDHRRRVIAEFANRMKSIPAVWVKEASGE